MITYLKEKINSSWNTNSVDEFDRRLDETEKKISEEEDKEEKLSRSQALEREKAGM